MTEYKMIKVTLVKSLIGTVSSHRACAKGLGLRRRGAYRSGYCHPRIWE